VVVELLVPRAAMVVVVVLLLLLLVLMGRWLQLWRRWRGAAARSARGLCLPPRLLPHLLRLPQPLAHTLLRPG
jgi:hypothetical protein